MSTPSPTLTPNARYHEDPHSSPSTPGPGPQPQQLSSSTAYPITRTVAIIKTHALAHRFDIEPRIQEASFEIVKERQMEFDTETDPETLYELFGEDAASLAEGPVWVYVLERRRAVEVWNTLMGDRDPAVARKDAPNSLRALYGLTLLQNGLMGSADTQIAEIQIASLFASSPPFPTADLPDGSYGSMRSVSSSVLSALRRATSDEGYAPSSATNPSTVGGSNGQGKLNGNGKPLFRARAVPATTGNPDIVPRTTRAAALRAGQAVEKTTSTPRVPISKERLAKTFENVPGHKRAESIAVASTAAPTIAPRMTRAASLRLGQKPEAPKRRITLNSAEAVKNMFEGVPGHKRRESIVVASAKAPTVAPRLNKSAALRAQKEQAPPSSFMFRAATAPKLPGLSRSNSQSSLSSTPSRTTQAPPPRPSSQASQGPPSRYAIARSSSVVGQRTPKPPADPKPTTPTTDAPAPAPAPKTRPRASSAATPSIAPRTNRSALLRAAKQEAENAAAAAAAAKKNPRTKLPPSSFKAVAS